MADTPAYENRDHPGNAIRPDVRCTGCGVMGCTTAWGPWCFDCNVKRLRHLDQRFAELEASLLKTAAPKRIDVWCCGKCMNSTEFVARTIVPKQGRCEWCNAEGVIWELLGAFPLAEGECDALR